MSAYRVVPAGDAALLVEWPAQFDADTSGRVVALAAAIRARHADMVRDVVVGYCSVTAYFDPLRVDADRLESTLRSLADESPSVITGDGMLIDVPVRYGGVHGPDLAEVAAFAGIAEEEVVALHCAAIYRVYVVGFVPGFAYMAPVDPRIAAPRRATPRARVPAGSVAIAAGQTGIYPSDTPGGWHLIGRTTLKPYDPSRSDPFMFHPGDRVRFHPVDPRDVEGAV